MGFSTNDCTKALEICNGQLDDAALWLTQNATHMPDDIDTSPDSRSAISFETIEVTHSLFLNLGLILLVFPLFFILF